MDSSSSSSSPPSSSPSNFAFISTNSPTTSSHQNARACISPHFHTFCDVDQDQVRSEFKQDGDDPYLEFATIFDGELPPSTRPLDNETNLDSNPISSSDVILDPQQLDQQPHVSHLQASGTNHSDTNHQTNQVQLTPNQEDNLRNFIYTHVTNALDLGSSSTPQFPTQSFQLFNTNQNNGTCQRLLDFLQTYRSHMWEPCYKKVRAQLIRVEKEERCIKSLTDISDPEEKKQMRAKIKRMESDVSKMAPRKTHELYRNTFEKRFVSLLVYTAQVESERDELRIRLQNYEDLTRLDPSLTVWGTDPQNYFE